jgi:general stress protein CsbA
MTGLSSDMFLNGWFAKIDVVSAVLGFVYLPHSELSVVCDVD